MTTKAVSTNSLLDCHVLNPTTTRVFGNKARTVIIRPNDPVAIKLANQLPRPSLISSNVSMANTEETLREIRHKTLNYKASTTCAETNDWKQKTNRELDIFVQKASLFSIVSLMDKDIDGPQLLEIVNETCSTHRSVFDVYMEKSGRKHSFFQQLLARWRYFFYFKTNIISNTLSTFVRTFLDKLRSELVQKEGGKNITTLINRALSETSSFLDFYLQATENYAKGIDLHGARDVHITHELSEKLGLSEEVVCRNFALTAVREFLPQVHFFQDIRNSPWGVVRIIGISLDSTLGWIFNRLILRTALKKNIPFIFQSIVKTSIDSTQPSNLSFVVSITQGILEQLRKFKSQIELTQDSPPETPLTIAGTEKLPEVIKKFIELLKLESCQTRKELLEPREKGRLNPFKIIDKKIDADIEESCIEGCRAFLSYLTKQENSEEIFYSLFNLMNTAFESNQQDLKKLQDQYDALKIEMQREAGELFQTVIRRSVNKTLLGLPESQIKETAAIFEAQQRSRSVDTIQQLFISDQSIQSKLASLQQKPSNGSTQQLNIVQELDSMNETIDNYRNLAVLDDTKKFDSSIQLGIEQAMFPIFSGMNALLDQITYAKKINKQHQEDVSFYNELKNLNAILQNSTGFKISECKKSLECLHTLCSNAQSQHAAFDDYLGELGAILQNLEKESQITQSLLSLDQKGGMLPKLYHAVMARINGLSVSFRWKDLQNIPEISNLEENERKQLHQNILAIAACGDLEQMNSKWGQLKENMNHLFSTHRAQQKKLFIQSNRKVQQYLQAIEISTSSMQQNLIECSRIISNDIQTIAKKSSEIRIHKVESISTHLINAMGGLPATLGAVSGAVFSAAATFLPKTYAYPIIGATGALLGYVGQGKVALINTAAIAATRLAAFYVPGMHTAIPLLVGTIGGYWEGRKLKKEIPARISDQVVFPQVMNVFDRLYDFILKPHVWKWAIVDTLKCLHEAYQ